MQNKISKGMILAAGFGTRLKPITDEMPKALVEAGERPVIEYSIALLVKGGIKNIVINLHHLGDQIENYLGDGSEYGAKFVYSKEEKILGTAGGIKRALPLLGKQPFVVVNGDIITDLNLQNVIRRHFESESDATMVLRPLVKGETYTPIKEEGGYIKEFGSGNLMFTGVQIVDPKIFDRIEKDKYSNTVTDIYVPMLKERRSVSAYIHEGYWTEIGTVESLQEARKFLCSVIV